MDPRPPAELAAGFDLGPWLVQPRAHELIGADERRRVGAKAMAMLLALAEQAGEVVAKDELVRRVWEGSFTSDEALSAVLYELRRALGDDAREPRFIETIRKSGYRLVAVVQPRHPPAAAVPPTSGEAPPASAPEVPPTSGNVSRVTTSPPRYRPWGWWVGGLAVLVAVGLWLGGGRGGGQPEAEIRSLAVLPVSALQSGESHDLVAVALTEMLTADLAQLCPQEVTPGISVRSHGAGRWRLEQVAEVLGVDAVVEGSVLRTGDLLWISVQLVETSSGRMLWSGSWERPVGDELRALREVALDAARQIQLRLGEAGAAGGPKTEPGIERLAPP